MSSNERFHGLDALRSFCMLFGILVHTTSVANFGVLELFANVSDFFRMATFFCASAFLSSLILSKRSARDFVRRRLVTLGVPLVFGILIINPLTIIIIADVKNLAGDEGVSKFFLRSLTSDATESSSIVWHLHLWFLFSLLFYTAVCSSIRRTFLMGRLNFSMTTIINFTSPRLRLTSLALFTVILSLLIRLPFDVATPVLMNTWIFRATILYLPFFVLGVALQVFPSLWRQAAPFDVVLVCTAVAAATLYLFSPILDESSAGKLVSFCVERLVVVAAVLTLFVSFNHYVVRPNFVIQFVISGIYTLYIVHYALIYLVALFIPTEWLSLPVSFWIISITVIIGGLSFHHFVVQRSKLLLFLLNGVRQER